MTDLFKSCLLALALLGEGWAAALPVPAAPQIGARSYLLVDYDSGKVLASSNPDERLEPASLTKLMTSYLAFEELRNGNMSLEELVPVSEKAWRVEGSEMFIEVDTKVSVGELLKGVIIQSGNDASIALAEHIAGSEEVFASLMNQYGQTLGLTGTNFENSTGLPHPDHYTTARDVATLSAALIRRFPDYYRWYSEKEFTYNGIRQHNRNNLLWRDPAVDGLKTGHTQNAGYCLAASAKRGGMRLISVIMGSDNEKTRADETQKLLNYGFRFFETHRLYSAGEELRQAQVWKGAAEQIPLGIEGDLYVTIPRGQYDALRAETDIQPILTAPIPEAAELGRLRVMLGEEVQATVALLALEAVPEGGFWHRLTDSIALWFHDEDEQ